MSRELNLTTQMQEFTRESYLKEMQTRFNWWRHYRQNRQPESRLKSKAKVMDHFKLPTVDSSIQAKLDNKNCPNMQHVQNLEDGKKSDQQEPNIIESEMRPVSPETRSLLYHGTSKEEKGRYHYLKIRNGLGPEEKYCYPIVTSWVYGWHLGNLAENSCPQHRRCCIVKDSFYTKNGIPTQPNRADMAL